MKILVQRVSQASVCIEKKIVGSIGKGALVFVGITHSDSYAEVCWLANKLVELRLFQDEAGKTNCSLKQVSGQVLIVSQFTLYADCNAGRRPSFTLAAEPSFAKNHYENFIAEVQKRGVHTECGVFGADMQVSLVNDGPVTLLLEKNSSSFVSKS